LAFSSLVITITIAALAFFLEEEKADELLFFLMAVLLLIINFAAIQFIEKSTIWIKLHQQGTVLFEDSCGNLVNLVQPAA